MDSAGFNERHRLIIAALIGPVDVVVSTDMLARSLASFGVSRADIVTLAKSRPP